MDTRVRESLDRAAQRFQELDRLLADPEVVTQPRQLRELSRERARLADLMAAWDRYQVAEKQLVEARELADGAEPEIADLARAEVEALAPELERLESRIATLLVPPDPDDDRPAVVEVRAGAGGEEAALFAAEIFRMYARYAEGRGWRVEVLSTSESATGGFKEVVLAVQGAGAYGRLKYESGVHRVQRVPVTEAAGRIHTSAVSVAVLPEAEEVDVALDQKDLEIEVFRSSGPGGQSVNTSDSAVRVRHLPSGIVVQCQDERSQLKNKAKALKVLRARLLDLARREQEQRIGDMRRSQISTGDRSAKVRTYNFPQGRVTDHRIGLTLHKLPQILEGDLDEFADALMLADRSSRLAEAGAARD